MLTSQKQVDALKRKADAAEQAQHNAEAALKEQRSSASTREAAAEEEIRSRLAEEANAQVCVLFHRVCIMGEVMRFAQPAPRSPLSRLRGCSSTTFSSPGITRHVLAHVIAFDASHDVRIGIGLCHQAQQAHPVLPMHTSNAPTQSRILSAMHDVVVRQPHFAPNWRRPGTSRHREHVIRDARLRVKRNGP